jgi:hypothetical protein
MTKIKIISLLIVILTLNVISWTAKADEAQDFECTTDAECCLKYPDAAPEFCFGK